MPWYVIALTALCAVISPFEALYLYNKAEEMKRRRKKRNKREEEHEERAA